MTNTVKTTSRKQRWELINRLRVMTEGHEEGVYHKIWEKCKRALDSQNVIVRLTAYEKELLSYKLEHSASEKDTKVLNYFINR